MEEEEAVVVGRRRAVGLAGLAGADEAAGGAQRGWGRRRRAEGIGNERVGLGMGLV